MDCIIHIIKILWNASDSFRYLYFAAGKIKLWYFYCGKMDARPKDSKVKEQSSVRQRMEIKYKQLSKHEWEHGERTIHYDIARDYKELAESYLELSITETESEQESIQVVLDYAFKALHYFRRLYDGDNSDWVLMCHRLIGYGFMVKNEYELSMDYYKRAMHVAGKLHREDKNHKYHYALLADTGTIYYKRGEYDNALQQLEAALKSASVDENNNSPQFNTGALFTQLGHIHRRQNDANMALDHYTNALDVFKTIAANSPLWLTLAQTYHHIGNAYRELSLMDKAITSYEKALESANKNGEVTEPVEAVMDKTFVTLGLIYHEQGDREQAIANFEQCKTLVRSIWGLTPVENPDILGKYNDIVGPDHGLAYTIADEFWIRID